MAVPRKADEVPFEPALSRSRGRHLLAYANKVYDIGARVAGIQDSRQDPDIPLSLIGLVLFVAGLLRVRSFNALEAELEKPWFAHAVGAKAPESKKRLFSAETASRALIRMGPKGPRQMLEGIIHQAERNKVFREGWVGALRYVAIDGWEPIRSFSRHCQHCLEREVTVGEGDKKRKVTQYYHRVVVALLLGPHEEVVLGLEPLRTLRERRASGEAGVSTDEGEETAAIRLVRRLRETYGRWLDVIVADGLYANGPFLTELDKLGFGAVIVAKKEGDEPLKEALNLWVGTPPAEVVEDREANERIEFWDCKDLETLDTFKGKIRVTRAIIRPLKGEPDVEPREWCFISIGLPARRLTPRQLLKVIRSRWHIENTGFNQWTQHWPFEHVFVTDWRGMEALLTFLFATFNVLQLFVYRQVKDYARLKGTDPTKTIIRLVREIRDDLVANATTPLVWQMAEEIPAAEAA